VLEKRFLFILLCYFLVWFFF